MRLILISLTLLSLGSACAAAESSSVSRELKADRAEVARSDFASRFDDAVTAIARANLETQRLRDEAAKTTAKLVGTGNTSKVQ